MFKYDLDIKGVCILEQKVIEDNRGYFLSLIHI